jgi:mono/diheme cytochrome c family protein
MEETMTQDGRHTLPRRFEGTAVSLAATLLVALLLALPALMWTGCAKGQEAEAQAHDDTSGIHGAASPVTAADKQSTVERGKYLVTIGGCNDCHTPMKEGPKGPEWDMSRMLSGHPEDFKVDNVFTGKEGFIAAKTGTAFTGGWGTSFAMNLTPDSLTGIGTWTEEMFMKTIRTGKHWGVARPIMPPMPWFNYGKMTDEDLKSVYAYLRTIPPIKNQPPAYRPPA